MTKWDVHEIQLYKGGTEGSSNIGNEPFSEYYAYQVADKMGLCAVHYDLENRKGIEKIIYERARELLSLPRVKTKSEVELER